MNLYPSQVPPPSNFNAGALNPPISNLPVLVLPIDWQRVRIDAAIAVMKGMYANPVWNDTPQEVIAGMAAAQADALITELQREAKK